MLRTAPAELDADGKAVGAACCRRCGIAHDWDAYWVARCGPPPDAPLLLLPSAIEQEEPAPPPPPPAGELESAFIALFGRRAGPRDPAVGRPAALDLASATATLERAAAEMAAAAAADHDGEESKARKRHHPHLHLRKSGFSDRMAGPTCPMDRATVGGRVPRLRCEVESLEAELNALTSWCGSLSRSPPPPPAEVEPSTCVRCGCVHGWQDILGSCVVFRGTGAEQVGAVEEDATIAPSPAKQAGFSASSCPADQIEEQSEDKEDQQAAQGMDERLAASGAVATGGTEAH